MSVDWPPALHVWPRGLALDYPGAEPLSLGVVQGGDGDGVGGGQKLSEPLSEHPGLGPGGAAWVMVTQRVLHVCGSACGAPGRECHPPASPFGDGSKSTEEGDAHPPIPPSAWAGSRGGGTGPAPATAGFQPCPAPGSCREGSGQAVASPALLVLLNLPPALRQGASKGALHPLWLPGQVGLGGGAKLCLFPRLRLRLPPGWGPLPQPAR